MRVFLLLDHVSEFQSFKNDSVEGSTLKGDAQGDGTLLYGRRRSAQREFAHASAQCAILARPLTQSGYYCLRRDISADITTTRKGYNLGARARFDSS
jgi:hypothetical protein